MNAATPPKLHEAPRQQIEDTGAFWSLATAQWLTMLESSAQGLDEAEARRRLEKCADDQLEAVHHSSALRLFLSQFQSPIILILLIAAGLSFWLHDQANALIILCIVVISGMLGFWQEHGAADAVAKLLALVQVTTTVRRGGKAVAVPSGEIVPGDVIELSAGSRIPGDCLIIESNDLYVNEAALTGET